MANILTREDYAALPVVAGDIRIAYGDHADQFGELFLPHDSPNNDDRLPTVILIHGGCWRDQFGLHQLGQMARRLADTGIAVWNIEYRRIGTGGGWPYTFLDVAAGADHLRVLADEYPLDLDQVIAVGHSAGGHLAFWLAGRLVLPEESPLWTTDPLLLSGVIDLAGLPDLHGAVKHDLCFGAPQELMGGLPSDVPERYASGSVDTLLPFGVPHVHIVGDADIIVPVDYLTGFVERALDQGDDVKLTILAGVGHFEIVVVGSSVWQIVEETIAGFADR